MQGMGKLVEMAYFRLVKRALKGGPGMKLTPPDRLVALQVVSSRPPSCCACSYSPLLSFRCGERLCISTLDPS